MTLLLFSCSPQIPAGDESDILTNTSKSTKTRFKNITKAAGLDIYSTTFGAAFADLNADDRIDLIVSHHGHGPALYINRDGEHFEDRTGLLYTFPTPDTVTWGDFFEKPGRAIRRFFSSDQLPPIPPNVLPGDLHGVVVVDFDNDGDPDIGFAAGGADGVGKGRASVAFANLSSEKQSLEFDNISTKSGLEESSRYRSRSLLPLPSRDGTKIDLYLTNKKKDGYENRYYTNNSDETIAYKPNTTISLAQLYSDEGMDAFVDLDRDGDVDFLNVHQGSVFIHKQSDGDFARLGRLPTEGIAIAVAVGDLNNDGYPDVFVGTHSRYSKSDTVVGSDERVHFHLLGLRTNDVDEIAFATQSDSIDVQLRVKPGLEPNDPSNIWLGASGYHPVSRTFSTDKASASGKPQIGLPGTYIWHDTTTGKWNLVLIHKKPEKGEASVLGRGSIVATAISGVTTNNLETSPKETVRDYIFLNNRGRFEPWPGNLPALTHESSTAACAFADLDNNGFLDVIGIRRRGEGSFNGVHFVLMNFGAEGFRTDNNHGLNIDNTDPYQADQLITGDIDNDGRMDVFITNGWGLAPGNTGPYQLFSNVTANPGNYVAIDLEGRQSNRDGLGAQVELWGKSPTSKLSFRLGFRELGAGFNRSQSSRILHFGLGNYSGALTAKIRWPTGNTSNHDLETNRQTKIVESD
jgi:VCBS repeat protein/ASPIC/UnbV protein